MLCHQREAGACAVAATDGGNTLTIVVINDAYIAGILPILRSSSAQAVGRAVWMQLVVVIADHAVAYFD